MNLLTFFVCVNLFCCLLFGTVSSGIYDCINLINEDPFHYYANSKNVENIFDENDIKVAIEVGSWMGGGSTRHMGELLKKRGGVLYAIDTWLGNTTQQPGCLHYQPILPQVYQQFLSNMIHWNLTDVVVPCRMRSLEAAKALKVTPDLIYIDAEHTTEAVYEDLVAWYPLVEGRGILCGDDWGWESVRLAVQTFANERGLMIEADGAFWRLY